MNPNSNECQAEDGLNFNFSYDSTSGKHGYKDSNGTFIPFESGGTDVSDTTATASRVLSGYYFYTAQGVRTQGNIVTRSATNKIISSPTTYSAGYYPNSWTVKPPTTLEKYSGNITSLPDGNSGKSAITFGDYAVFAGGYSTAGSGSFKSNVDYYNSVLTKSYASPGLSQARSDTVPAKVGSYVLFAGGQYAKYSPYYIKTVDAFDTSFTRSAPDVLNQTAFNTADKSAAVGNYTLIAIGYYCEVYDINLTHSATAFGTLSHGNASNWYCGSANLPSYAVFKNGSAYSTFNSDLTSTIVSYGYQGTYINGCAIGDYAIFAGGQEGSSNIYNTAYSISNSLSTGTASNLSAARYDLRTTATENYMLFGAGSNSSYNDKVIVDAYIRDSLTRSVAPSLRELYDFAAAATAGNKYALFGPLSYDYVDGYYEV